MASRLRVGVVVVLVTMAVASYAQGEFIVQPVSGTADSSYSPDTSPLRAYNGSGLSDTSGVETGDAVPAAWPTHGAGGTTTRTQWLSASSTGDALRWIRFDLGQAYHVTGMHVWNYNAANQTNYGFRYVDVLVSTNGVDFTKVAADLELARASGLTTYAGETYTIPCGAVRYIQIEGLKSRNWGGSMCGLAEVRFLAVPEPATCGLLCLGTIALLRRRRAA